MEAELPRVAIAQIALKTQGNAAKGKFIPRNFVRGDQGYRETFVACCIFRAFEASAIEQVHLVDVRNADQGERCIDGNACAGFFMGFTNRPLGGRFTVFHEASR